MAVGAKPTIGVTGPDRGGTAAWWFTWLAIRRAGGRAIRITPSRPRPNIELDGLVIGGGADVAESLPPLESAPPQQQAPYRSRSALRRLLTWMLLPLIVVVRWVLARRRPIGEDLARDRLELRLLERASAKQLPTLGICRGAQLMAVHGGGELVRDVGQHYEERAELWTVLPRRAVSVEDGTGLQEIVETPHLMANSLHRDAVAEVEPPMQIAAREEATSVTQAIEDPTAVFWYGVQWHPEYLPQESTHQRLFAELVRHATGDAARHSP